jgi:hypothetical protein
LSAAVMNPIDGTAEGFPVQAGDIVYVPRRVF